MDRVLDSLKKEYLLIRTGRASPSLVEEIIVNYYETNTPLKQLASITTPDPKMIVIEPWDKNVLQEIEKGISHSDLGLTPNNDGNVIRVTLPALTTERRDELVKTAKKIAEEHRVSLRTIRREANDHIKKMQKASEITEDESFHHQESIQKKVDEHTKSIDTLLSHKEAEIRE